MPIDGAHVVVQSEIEHCIDIVSIGEEIRDPIRTDCDSAVTVETNHAKRPLEKCVVNGIVRVVRIHREREVVDGGLQPVVHGPATFRVDGRLNHGSICVDRRRAVAGAITVRGVRLYTINEDPVVVLDVVVDEVTR